MQSLLISLIVINFLNFYLLDLMVYFNINRNMLLVSPVNALFSVFGILVNILDYYLSPYELLDYPV